MKTGHIKRCMESKSEVRIELTNYHDPSDGTTTLGATVKDGYTGEVLIVLEWYYDFEKLMIHLDQQMAELI